MDRCSNKEVVLEEDEPISITQCGTQMDGALACRFCLHLSSDAVLLACRHPLCRPCAVELYLFRRDAMGEGFFPSASRLLQWGSERVEDTTALRTEAPTGVVCPECLAFTACDVVHELPPEEASRKGTTEATTNSGTTVLPRISLPTDEALAEKVAVVQATVGRVLCGVCEHGTADWYCIDCRFELCTECRTSEHQRGKYKAHRITALGNSGAGVPRRKGSHSCKVHANYDTDLFCIPCQTPICLLCSYRGEHKSHEAEPIQEALESLFAQLRASVSHVEQTVQDLREKVSTELETTLAALGRDDAVVGEDPRPHATSVPFFSDTQRYARLKATIRDEFDALVTQLEARKRTLLSLVDTHRTHHEKQLASYARGVHAISRFLAYNERVVRAVVAESTHPASRHLLSRRTELLHRANALVSLRVDDIAHAIQGSSVPTLRVTVDGTASFRRMVDELGDVTVLPAQPFHSSAPSTLLPRNALSSGVLNANAAQDLTAAPRTKSSTRPSSARLEPILTSSSSGGGLLSSFSQVASSMSQHFATNTIPLLALDGPSGSSMMHERRALNSFKRSSASERSQAASKATKKPRSTLGGTHSSDTTTEGGKWVLKI